MSWADIWLNEMECPKCGHHAVVIEQREDMLWVIRCDHCGITTNRHLTYGQARDEWDEIGEKE